MLLAALNGTVGPETVFDTFRDRHHRYSRRSWLQALDTLGFNQLQWWRDAARRYGEKAFDTAVVEVIEGRRSQGRVPVRESVHYPTPSAPPHRFSVAPARVREAHHPEPVNDPEYIIQGLYDDGMLTGDEFGFDDEETTLREAKKLASSAHFEGDRVRVITRDGELVWDSLPEDTSRRRHTTNEQMREGETRYWYSIWGKTPGYGYATGWTFGATPEDAVAYALKSAKKWSRGFQLPVEVNLQSDKDPYGSKRTSEYFSFLVDADGHIEALPGRNTVREEGCSACQANHHGLAEKRSSLAEPPFPRIRRLSPTSSSKTERKR